MGQPQINNPLVSIIVFAYNSSQFIIETLDSAKKQTYENIELIITDDCSTDSTIALCSQWLEIHKSRFVRSEIVLAQKNTGLPGNCNRGWKAANGRWIKYIAGDDYLLPNCIEKYIKFVQLNLTSKIVFANAILVDEVGNLLPNQKEFYKNDFKGWRSYFFNQPVKKQCKLFSRDPIFLVTPSLFVERELLMNIDGFDENLQIFEDIPFVLRCLNYGCKLYSIPENTVVYRIHSNAISRIKDKAKEIRALKEFAYIYSNYRKPHLSIFNILDLGARFQAWLQFKYVLKYHLKGARFLAYFNTFRWYQYFVSAFQK
jgi:glycosyltransferase involved in cell wall biosynthesis